MKHFLPIAFIAAGLVGCSGDSAPTVAPNVTTAQQRSASASMGVSFPPETQFLMYHRASEEQSLLPAPDDAVHLKIELPKAAAAQFLARPPFSKTEWETTQSWVQDGPKWKDWKPSQVKKFRSAQIALPKAQSLNVLIDDGGTENTVVYLMWFET